jgi:succinoglycan biosynthesis protein ExoM
MNDKLIAVCVPSFKRPELLRTCLLAIDQLQPPEQYSLNIVIADNDQEQSAQSVYEELASNAAFPMYYCVEAERGLSCVRNRLLEETLKLNAALVAFIDDDEQPERDWLVQHVKKILEFGADVSTGPVRPVSQALALGDKKTKVSGSKPRNVSTNNVVFSTKLIGAQALRFDPFYNFIGGEDFDFFQRSLALGNSHVWVEEALVLETIPVERDNLRYLFYRHFTGGINSVLRYKRNRSAWRAWARYLPKILGKLIASLVVSIAACLCLNKSIFIASVKKLASGLGYLAGLLNVVVERYKYVGSEQS